MDYYIYVMLASDLLLILVLFLFIPALIKKQPKTELRPWGSYTVLIHSTRYKVKEIYVHPGAALSLQLHHHRSEHWIVTSGTAKVTRNNDSFFLAENESTYIPIGVIHRLENPGKIPLKIVEIQNGSYLNEDDIIRLEDLYNRNNNS